MSPEDIAAGRDIEKNQTLIVLVKNNGK